MQQDPMDSPDPEEAAAPRITSAAISRMLSKAGHRKNTSGRSPVGFQLDQRHDGTVNVWAASESEANVIQRLLEVRYETVRDGVKIAVVGRRQR